MRRLKIISLLVFVVCSLSVNAAEGFRLINGKLISTGKSKPEIYSIAGAPLYHEVETIAVDEGRGEDPIKRELLTYRLPGAIGGMYLVIVTVENNTVVDVASKQEGRL